ncbi:MAG: glycosyltransferase family 4 protein [Bacteroidetes bacterium]|nr:glycosyltransferase family 4 protein [Bacteroidota bacterium]
MKIALLTDGISPYVIGGMQKHSFYLAKYLSKNKIYVDLYHMNQSNLNIHDLAVFTEEEKKFITSIVLPFPKLDQFPGHYVRESYRYSELIFNEIKKKLNTYDFIYTKGFSGWKLIEEKQKGLACPSIGVKFHGYEMFQDAPDFKTKLQHLLLRRSVKWINQHADFVFSYGGKITEIIKSLNVSVDRIIEIPTGIEPSWMTNNPVITNPVKRFVFIGRQERRKGIEELTTVLSKILNTHNFVFEFIGPIDAKKRIVASNIVYHGELRDIQQIKNILQHADVLVCPSHSEGMPNVIMEGMASGLAVLATDVGAVREELKAGNGILIRPSSIEALEKAIVTFIDMSQEDLTKMKRSSIDSIKLNFLWDDIILETIDRIKTAIKS